MAVSILLRLLPVRASDDAIADVRGEAEVVETGETALFKDGRQMLDFLKKVTEHAHDEGGFDGRQSRRG